MKEKLDDGTIIDDEFSPLELSISEGLKDNLPTTHFSITLEADFDEKFEEIFENFELEMSGYLLESIIIKYLESISPEIIDTLDFDSELSTFVAYADNEENQRIVASNIYKLCTSTKLFRSTIKKNLDSIREN
jgi:hypothetical protein